MIITKTPYRLSFFGGGTDYRSWFEENSGLVITSAMARYLYLTVRKLPPFFEYRTRIVYGEVEMVNSNEEIIHPSVKKCLQYFDIKEGLEIHYDGDLPSRSGIGSSSTFTVAMLNALHGLRYEMVTKKTLADEAINIEQNIIKENVGIQDQIIAAYGGIQVIEMGPGNSYKLEPLILPPDYLSALENHILLAFTGQVRLSSKFAGEQIKNIKQGNSTDYLREIQHIAREALNLFRNKANLEKVGELLNHSWRLKKELAQGVSNNEIDVVINSAIKAGAYGGKLMGAGGGGFIFLLAPPCKHESIKKALSCVKVWVQFKVDKIGSQIIFHNDSD